MVPKSILIIGNYGAGNLGDDAILGGIVTQLRNLGYQGEIQVTHGGVNSSPEIYKKLRKVDFFPVRYRYFRHLTQKRGPIEALQRADLVILGGGGLFVDSESWKAPIIWSEQAKACQKIGKPYICFGQSIGPLKHWWSRYLTKQVFQNAQSVHVRDALSAEQLKKWGVEATVGIDPAFSWLLEQRRSIPRKPILLVSLREWPGFSDWKLVVKEIQVFAKRKKLKPILLSMDLREDKKILQETGLEFYQPQSALAAFEAFQKAECAVTMRLHAGIFSVAGRTPVLAFSYSQKVKAQLEGMCPILMNFNPEKFRETLKSLSKAPSTNLEKKLIENQHFLERAFR